MTAFNSPMVFECFGAACNAFIFDGNGRFAFQREAFQMSAERGGRGRREGDLLFIMPSCAILNISIYPSNFTEVSGFRRVNFCLEWHCKYARTSTQLNQPPF